MFFQDGPTLKNQFSDDLLLQDYLKTNLPDEVYRKISPSLQDLGERAAGELLEWAVEAERTPPELKQYDAWGRRVDEIVVSEAWKKYEAFSAQYGIVAAAYEREFGAYSRIYQMTLLYLFHPSSAIASCPLAMTDGAARAIELYGDEAMKSRAFKHLTSRDPKKFWTSGQWMTERTGGSDVGRTETIAKKTKDGYELSGVKWFTSATTSQMAMTLARVEGAEPGSRGLSLFYLETRGVDGGLNGIEIHRLKDKMGTKALPTAELSLKGTKAQVVGGEGNGVRKISALFNITRVYNAICSIAQMRRGLALAYDYAQKREAFGKKLIDHPLHKKTLDDLQLEWSGCFHLVYRAAELLGKDECGTASEHEKTLLRVLTPIAKLYAGKMNVLCASEILESFGGAGYIEDTGLPRLLRDGQVLSIWEGTTNVLSLDMLRAFQKEKGFEALTEELSRTTFPQVAGAWKNVLGLWQKVSAEGPVTVETHARELAFAFARVYIAQLMFLFAEKTKKSEYLKDAQAWCDLYFPSDKT